jgi:hypothetical protein
MLSEPQKNYLALNVPTFFVEFDIAHMLDNLNVSFLRNLSSDSHKFKVVFYSYQQYFLPESYIVYLP